jgi:hypothetical protein
MRKIRWGWILVAGILAEAVAVAFLVGLRRMHGYAAASAAPLSAVAAVAFEVELFVGTAVAGWWVARKATAWPVLNGALVGVTTVLVYEILAFGQPVPRDWSYFLLHGLKVAGGVTGGCIAAWHARAPASAPVS